MFPSRSQWREWSLPSKAGYLGAWIGGIGLLIAIAIPIVLPLIHTGLDYLSRWPIPKADPDRFSILVAHLENDANREHERLIIEALKEFEGIQVLALDRTVPLEGSLPEEAEKRGHESARCYLKQSGASVLIWGTILRLGDRTVPKLYWTPSHGGELKPKRYDAPLIEKKLRLPEVFWSDLAEILNLIVASYDAEFRGEAGHYLADRLSPFIARVRTLLLASTDRPGWDAGARAITRIILANSLGNLGRESGERQPLEEAVQAYSEALKVFTRERAPLKWAEAQNNLGVVLLYLGEWERGTKYLQEAVQAFREALKESTRERDPMEWTFTQNNLGIVLYRLGEREEGTKHLEEAVQIYREALKERTRERVPLDWATTMHNLGNALRALGERESGTKHLEEAVHVHREALKERSRELVPLDWAKTQNNLGNVLTALGERGSGTKYLEEAVQVFREALKERTRERVPQDWATTQNNLGNALRVLGERESGTKHLEEAVQAFNEALKELTRERIPMKWAFTQNNLGNTLGILGDRTNSVDRVCSALDAHCSAWEIFNGETPFYASIAIKAIKADLSIMRMRFTAEDFRRCLERNANVLSKAVKGFRPQNLIR